MRPQWRSAQHRPQQGPLLSSLPAKPHLDPRPDCVWVSPRGESPYQVHMQPRSRPPRSTVQTQKQPHRPRTPETGPGAPALVWPVRSRWGPWETSFPGIRKWSRQGGFGRWSGLGAHGQQAPGSVWLRPGSVRLGVPSTALPPSRRPAALTSRNHGSQPTCLRGRLQRQCRGRGHPGFAAQNVPQASQLSSGLSSASVSPAAAQGTRSALSPVHRAAPG